MPTDKEFWEKYEEEYYYEQDILYESWQND